MRAFTVNAALVTASLVIALFAIEGGARLMFSSLGAPYWTHRDFRLTRPAPYADAEYFSAAFIRESFDQPGGHAVIPGTRIVLPNDYAGQWFNVRDAKRTTPGVPQQASRRVLVFGGSTVYCSEVPDQLTLPSQIQARLEESAPGRFAVENFGVTSVNSSQQLERLRTMTLRPDDLVVFFDGVNDIYNAILFGRPDGWIVGENQNVLATLPSWQGWLVRRTMRLSERFHALRPLVGGGKLTLPPFLADAVVMENNLALMEKLYTETIYAAHEFVAAAGARFAHFVQPNLFVQGSLTAYEQGLLRMPLVIAPGSEIAFRAGTPRLVRAGESLRARGVDSADLTRVLADRPSGREYYLDAVHVAHEGNAVLAAAIVQHLLSITLVD